MPTSVRYERINVNSSATSRQIYLDLVSLLMSPGHQLMHTENVPWTRIERQAVLGLKLLDLTYQYEYDIVDSKLARWLTGTSQAELEEFEALLPRIGATAMIAPFRKLYFYVQRILARTPNRLLSEISDANEATFYRLRRALSAAESQLMEKLWLYLDRHATALRGTSSDRTLHEARFLAHLNLARSTPTLIQKDWASGEYYLLIADHWPSALTEHLRALPGARFYDQQGHFISALEEMQGRRRKFYLGANAKDFVLKLSDGPDAMALELDWLVSTTSCIYPLFICKSREMYLWFCDLAQSCGATFLAKHERLQTPSQARNGVFFWENQNYGYPAVLAARHEKVLPWLILNTETDCFWWCEFTADWDCRQIVNDYFFCRAKSETAVLNAFRQLSTDDNFCVGAVSGHCPEDQVLNLLHNYQPVPKMIARSNLAGWAYGHQWGGGSSEHFSIFHAKDDALTDLVAEYAASIGSMRISRF